MHTSVFGKVAMVYVGWDTIVPFVGVRKMLILPDESKRTKAETSSLQS